MAKQTKYVPLPGNDPDDYVMPGVRWFHFEDMRHYVRDCADLLGLRDWTIDYEAVIPDEVSNEQGAEGAVKVVAARMHFRIWLPPKWYTAACADAPLDQRQEARATVAHELLHVKFWRMDKLIANLYTNLGEQTHGIVNCFYQDEIEHLIDDLAYSVAEGLPLPAVPVKNPAQKQRKKQG